MWSRGERSWQSQLKKLKTESKASSSFHFKGNKLQYEFNSSILEAIDGAIKAISKGNLSAAHSELKRVKTLINKHNKLIHFADKSPVGWTAVKEYESDEFAKDSEDEKNSDQPRGERSSGFRRRSVEMRPATLALQLPTLKPVKLHLLVCPLAVCLLLVSLFFVCSPFEDDPSADRWVL